MPNKSTIFVLIVAVGVALFCTLDIFEPERKQFLKHLPNEVKELLNYVFTNEAGETENEGIDKGQTKSGKKERVFTKVELSEYDGSKDHKKLYLGIMGKVFDVSKGDKHYGPGGGYHFFTGSLLLIQLKYLLHTLHQ